MLRFMKRSMNGAALFEIQYCLRMRREHTAWGHKFSASVFHISSFLWPLLNDFKQYRLLLLPWLYAFVFRWEPDVLIWSCVFDRLMFHPRNWWSSLAFAAVSDALWRSSATTNQRSFHAILIPVFWSTTGFLLRSAATHQVEETKTTGRRRSTSQLLPG